MNKNKFIQAAAYGQVDGSHHKAWAIDQMVRVFFGSEDGEETEEYRKFVEEYEERDESGEPMYCWETGTAP